MAKKKSTLQSTRRRQAASSQPQSHTHSSTMEDPSEQLQSLKDLNAMLLKEASDGRKQVDSLLEAKEALNSSLHHSAMEKKLLEDQLFKAESDAIGLELENAVVLVFVETRLREMGFVFDALVAEKDEILGIKTEGEAVIASLKEEVDRLMGSLEMERDELRRLSGERDQMKVVLDGLISEADGLKDKVVDMEKEERRLKDGVEKFRMECEKMEEEKFEKEKAIQQLTTEKDLAQRSSEESAMAIENLKAEIERILREKNEIEREISSRELDLNRQKLELIQSGEALKNSRKVEALMRVKILDLEKSLGLAMQKEKDMTMEIRALLNEKTEKERIIQMLTERKDSVQKVLDVVQRDLKVKALEIEETEKIKNEIEQAKVRQESEIAELRESVDDLTKFVQELKESCRDLEDKNEKLLSQANHYRNAADEVIVQRDENKKMFEEEKGKVNELMLQVAGMEDKIKQTATELGQLRSVREKLIETNKMMETQMENLVNERDALQKSLLDARHNYDDARAKMEYLNQALAMLKCTAELVCESNVDMDNGDVLINERVLEEEMQPYTQDLDAIRNAFKSKSKMVEDMKQELAAVQNSVNEAHKRKGLWTVISSATTILAAAFVAFVARGR